MYGLWPLWFDYDLIFGFPKVETMGVTLTTSQKLWDGTTDGKVCTDYNMHHKVCNYYYG